MAHSDMVSLALDNLRKGVDVPLDLDAEYPTQPPPWLDIELYRKGQRCMQRYGTGILLGNLRSLVIGLAVPNLCDPLLMTNRSCTRWGARERYFETALLTLRLCEEQPWSPNSSMKSALKMIRHMHKSVGKRLRALRSQGSYEKCLKDTYERLNLEPSSSQDDALLEDLRHLGSRFETENALLSCYLSSSVLFSQTDMVLTQVAFLEQFVCFPEFYGGRFVSSDSKLGLLHLWRVEGYYLGIEDEFNLCQYDLQTFAEICDQIKKIFLLPCLVKANERSLHMARSFCRGVGAEYSLVIFHILRAYGIECKTLWPSFSLGQRLKFYLRTFVIEWLLALPLIGDFFNVFALKLLRRFCQK